MTDEERAQYMDCFLDYTTVSEKVSSFCTVECRDSCEQPIESGAMEDSVTIGYTDEVTMRSCVGGEPIMFFIYRACFDAICNCINHITGYPAQLKPCRFIVELLFRGNMTQTGCFF